MGDPVTPPPADRQATRELAARIVDSVRNDEPMELGLDPGILGRAYVREDVEQLAFRLAQEIVLLRDETPSKWKERHDEMHGKYIKACEERDNAIRSYDQLGEELEQIVGGCGTSLELADNATQRGGVIEVHRDQLREWCDEVDQLRGEHAFDHDHAVKMVGLARTVINKYGADADKPSVHLAKELLAGAHERDRLRDLLRTANQRLKQAGVMPVEVPGK